MTEEINDEVKNNTPSNDEPSNDAPSNDAPSNDEHKINFDINSMDEEFKGAMKEYVNKNWREFVDEEFATDGTYADIMSLNDVAKKGIHASKMIGRDKIVIPTKDASEEEWNDFYIKLGKPKSSDGYEFTISEEVPDEWQLSSMSKEFAEYMHKNNAPKEVAEKAWEYMHNKTIEGYKQNLSNYQDRINKELKEFKEELGTAYDEKMDLINNVATKFGGKEFVEWVKTSKLANESKLLRFAMKVGEALSDDKLLPKSRAAGGMTIAEAKAKRNKLMEEPGWDDKRHPDHEYLMKEADKLDRLITGYEGD